MRRYPIICEAVGDGKCARTHTYGEAVGDEKMPLNRQLCQHLSKVRKSALVPHTVGDKECARTPRLHKEPIFGRAINMHSRGSTEQRFYVMEPSHWYLHKVKKVRSYHLIC